MNTNYTAWTNRLENLKAQHPGERFHLKYEKLEKIGQGRYGTVYRAREIATDRIVAVKKISRLQGFPSVMIKELHILQMLDHRNVVKLIELSFDRENPQDFVGLFYFILEYCVYDLKGLLQETNKAFDLGEIKMVMKQLFTGLLYLETKKILHRDLKSANILITQDGVLKIADFGLSTLRNERDEYHENVVTFWYKPPELLLGETCYGPSIDIWGAGCVMVELWTIKPLFSGRNEESQLQQICVLCGSINTNYLKEEMREKYRLLNGPLYRRRILCTQLLPVVRDKLAVDLIDKIFCLNPAERINCRSALEHDFFSARPRPCKLNLRNVTRRMRPAFSTKNTT